MICVLEVVRGPAKHCRYVLRENQRCTLGRSPDVDISIPADNHLSRRHLQVECLEGRVSIRDLGSSNGTFLNQMQVTNGDLQTGDTLRIGMTYFRVAILDDDANPHSLDGVNFSPKSPEVDSGVSHVAASSRSIAFPGTVVGDVTARYFPESEAPVVGASLSASPTIQRIDAEGGDHGDSCRSTPLKELNSHFAPCSQPNLYELRDHYESPWGDYLGVLLKIAEGRTLLATFNVAQLDTDIAIRLEERRQQKKLVPLSRSVLVGSIYPNERDLNLLQRCLGQDAIVCIGSRLAISPELLKPFANSFGYPSMFGEHMKQSDPSLSSFLRSRRAYVLFEWNREGSIGIYSRR